MVDSRTSREGRAVRSRRECLRCGRRFTTYEYIEERTLQVLKRDGETGLAIHGVLPAAWDVVEATGSRLLAERRPAEDDGFRAAFPFAHVVRLEAELSPRALRIAIVPCSSRTRSSMPRRPRPPARFDGSKPTPSSVTDRLRPSG